MKFLKLATPTAIMIGLLSACGGNGSAPTTPGGNSGAPTTPTPTASAIPLPTSVQVLNSAYAVSVFAQAPGKSATPPVCDPSSPGCFTKPDSIIQMGAGSSATIFVAFGDALRPNGAISNTNSAMGNVQITQYDLNGNSLKTYTVPGHNDGMMAYDSHTIWAMSNEDSNPLLTVIDTTSGKITTYADDTIPLHGGGFDDMEIIKGTVYASASAPALNTATNLYDAPAIVTIALNADGKTFHTNPILMGNATATVINGSTVGITTPTAMLGNPLVPNGSNTNPAGLQDPDSMAIAPNGDLVLGSQGDSELVFVTNPGATQTVKELFLNLYTNPWPVDDTRWAPATSQFMLVTDTGAGLIYKVTKTGGFTSGDMYSAGQGTVLQDNQATGAMTQLLTGMTSPHGMLFVQ